MPQFLTKNGYKKLKKRFKKLKEERKEIAKRIEKAKEMGDISENAGYEKAKEDQAFTEGKIQKLKNIFRNAKIVEKQEGSKIGIGSQMKVKVDGEEKKLHLVGEGEIDPAAGKISYESPIGKKLMGKEKGDEITVETPSGETTYKVMEVS